MICFFVAASSDTRTPRSLRVATECPWSASQGSFRDSGGGDPLGAVLQSWRLRGRVHKRPSHSVPAARRAAGDGHGARRRPSCRSRPRGPWRTRRGPPGTAAPGRAGPAPRRGQSRPQKGVTPLRGTTRPIAVIRSARRAATARRARPCGCRRAARRPGSAQVDDRSGRRVQREAEDQQDDRGDARDQGRQATCAV